MAETVTPAAQDDIPPPTSTRRERTGWYFYDWANSAFQTTVITVFLGPFLTSVAKVAAGCELGADCTGYVYPLGIKVAAGSYYPYLISLSVLLTVFVLPVVGAIADRSLHKKRLLAGAAFTGAFATIGMVFVTGDRYLLGGALFLVANISLRRGDRGVQLVPAPVGWAGRTRRHLQPRLGAGLPRWRSAAGVEPGGGAVVRQRHPRAHPGPGPLVASSRPGCGGRRSPWCRCAGCGSTPPPRRWPPVAAATC